MGTTSQRRVASRVARARDRGSPVHAIGVRAVHDRGARSPPPGCAPPSTRRSTRRAQGFPQLTHNPRDRSPVGRRRRPDFFVVAHASRDPTEGARLARVGRCNHRASACDRRAPGVSSGMSRRQSPRTESIDRLRPPVRHDRARDTPHEWSRPTHGQGDDLETLFAQMPSGDGSPLPALSPEPRSNDHQSRERVWNAQRPPFAQESTRVP